MRRYATVLVWQGARTMRKSSNSWARYALAAALVALASLCLLITDSDIWPPKADAATGAITKVNLVAATGTAATNVITETADWLDPQDSGWPGDIAPWTIDIQISARSSCRKGARLPMPLRSPCSRVHSSQIQTGFSGPANWRSRSTPRATRCSRSAPPCRVETG